MTTLRECAEAAAAALVKKLRNSRGEVDEAAVADIIEHVLSQATKERDKGEKKRLIDLEASMQERLTRLLDASPAVIYSFKAKDDFAPIFVSDNIETPVRLRPARISRQSEFLARARAPRRLGADRGGGH